MKVSSEWEQMKGHFCVKRVKQKSNILKVDLCDLNIDDDGQIQVADQVGKF